MASDNETAEMWREWKRQRAAKRASNRDTSAQMLKQAGIQFESKNHGAHLIVAGRYDFWPGTGLWQARGEATKQRGVRRLIARIQAQSALQEK